MMTGGKIFKRKDFSIFEKDSTEKEVTILREKFKMRTEFVKVCRKDILYVEGGVSFVFLEKEERFYCMATLFIYRDGNKSEIQFESYEHTIPRFFEFIIEVCEQMIEAEAIDPFPLLPLND